MTLELIEAIDALNRLDPEERLLFVLWCRDIGQPMDDAHLPALMKTWRVSRGPHWPRLQPRAELG
jgi:hypothetical protein